MRWKAIETEHEPHNTKCKLNYQNLIKIWRQKGNCTFKKFLRRKNNNDVHATLETMQNAVNFHQNKGNN